MSQQSPMNSVEESSVPHILPLPPLCSSVSFKWVGIRVEYHQQPPLELGEHHLSPHVITIHHDQQIVRTKRILSGQQQQEQVVNGNIAIIPSNVPHQLSTDRAVHLTILMLEPFYLAQMAHENIDPDRVELIPQFAKPDPLIYQIGLSLKAELEAVGVDSRLYVESATRFLSVHLLRHYTTRKHTIKDYSDGLPQTKLRQALEYINEHLVERISLQEIANELGMSQYYFARLFKQSMGITPYQYAIQSRVEEAKRLLAIPALSIAQISQRLGFSNPNQLSTFFRKYTGFTPKNYRRSR